VKWRRDVELPKSLDHALWRLRRSLQGDQRHAAQVPRSVSSPRRIVPGLQVADAGADAPRGGQTAAYYYFGQACDFVFETGLPSP